MSGEKRSQESEDSLLAETAIIVDIEGTTTSIGFVKETLFPYVRENLKQYLEKNWDAEELKADLEKLKEQAKKDETDKVEGLVSITGTTPEEERESVVKNVVWQMDGDRKTGALKQLQGHMWREAYKSGAIKGHVYEDVPKAFDLWTKTGRKIYVYSSGSVEAQKLLFGHSEHGDMLKYFTDYFDTEVGAKQESSSYKKILEKIGAEPSTVLFLTDIVKEAEAAKEVGMSARIVVRPGNASLTDEEKVTFTTIESFMDLSFQTSAKRQKVEASEEKEKEKTAEPEVAKVEPMDTSEEEAVAETSEEKPAAEKIDDSAKPAESAKPEESKVAEKPEVTSMETESKVETEKKAAEVVVDKPAVVPEETKKKNDEESKVSEKVCEKVSEVVAAESTKVSSEIESEPKPKKESEVTKTETTKVEAEPMDEDKNDAPSKNESIATIKEDKTEKIENSEPTKPETKVESEVKTTETVSDAKTTETVCDAKTKVEVAETSSTIVEKVASPNASAAAETKVEKSADEKSTVTASEKTETEVAVTPTEKATVKADEKEVKEAKEETKQNGDSVATNNEEKETPADKTESNGDVKEEEAKKEEVVAATVETKDPVVETEKKVVEPIVESAKEDKEKETTKADESAPAAETADAKLNGTPENNCEKDKEDKPHRNGLNDDSSNEKTNGDTKVEASAQNGDAESSTGATAAAESIKSKKVVDSTIADGAGEPDVVAPAPVPVAATS